MDRTLDSRRLLWLLALLCLPAIGLSTACGEATPAGQSASQTDGDSLVDKGGDVDKNGKPTLQNTRWRPSGGKADGLRGNPGLPTQVDNSRTAVWEVRNSWSDTDPKAGMAWSENSGLTWNEKFRAWVDSMERTESESSYGDTFVLTTPYGKKLPAPALECAEAAIFLRVAFAAWYNLPFFMESRDKNGNRLFFGHFGMRTSNGRWDPTPAFRAHYADYSNLANQIKNGEREWPHDSRLDGLGIPSADDDQQPMIGDDARAGAYFDEIFLNKRVGYFLRYQLMYLGSMNLADSANTFNIKAPATTTGDFAVERTGWNGIGHTLIVKERRDLGTQQIDGEQFPKMKLEVASSSMPRRQPKWQSAAGTKRSLTDELWGGKEYAKYGAGVKRWRVPKRIRGRWTNVVPDADKDQYIGSWKHERLGKRIKVFDKILVELNPKQQMEAIAEVIESKRRHLRGQPASCAARIDREKAFDELYKLGEKLDMTKAEVDQKYRKFEDYVFAELVYDKSKTCCWLSANADMYDLIIEYNLNRARDEANEQCRPVKVFKARDDGEDGYAIFREYAKSVGQGDKWLDWSAGESCSQSDVRSDTEADHNWTPMCEIEDSVMSEFEDGN